MRWSAEKFGGDMRVSFLIEDKKLPEKYNKICVKISYSIKKEFDSEPV